jgi:hypothetical protein
MTRKAADVDQRAAFGLKILCRKPFILTTFRNNPFAFNGLAKMIKPYLAQNKAFKPKTPVGGWAIHFWV